MKTCRCMCFRQNVQKLCKRLSHCLYRLDILLKIAIIDDLSGDHELHRPASVAVWDAMLRPT